MSAMSVVGSIEAQKHFDELLERVDQGDEHLVVEKAGTPVAALIGIKEYEEFRRWLAARLLRELGPKLNAEADRVGITDENLEEKLKESRSRVNQRPHIFA